MQSYFLSFTKLICMAVLFTTISVSANGPDLVKPGMTQLEVTNLRTQLKKVERKSCSKQGVGTSIWNGSKYVVSSVADTLPVVPLAWTGIQALAGKSDRLKEKKIAAGGAAQLYITEGLGGAVMTVVSVATVIIEAMIEHGQTHDQVYVSGTQYNYNTGQVAYTTGWVDVPNGKEYQPTGAVEGVFGWLASAYSNTRTLSQAIERDRLVRAEVCRQALKNLAAIEVNSSNSGTAWGDKTPAERRQILESNEQKYNSTAQSISADLHHIGRH